MPAISIQHISKKFNRGGKTPYLAFRDVLGSAIKNMFTLQKSAETFWALKDINLDVAQGERIGIIGHNGAGKSTLLKIISRITPPSEGRIILTGRVASLLEVGTGFHPELTGRENIYLNGSILGLKKYEIKAKLDEIIEFSGIAPFIDTPLKNFSSGMQLRLAFSVAAHLNPEILLIDEVLAVGDIAFQKKCIGKMEEVSLQQGRTVVFVSHNLGTVRQLCSRAVVMRQGHIVFAGPVEDGIKFYTASIVKKETTTSDGSFLLSHHPNKKSSQEGLLHADMYVNNERTGLFTPGADLRFVVRYFLPMPLLDAEMGIVIKDEQHNPLIGWNNKHIGKKIQLKVNRPGELSILIPGFNIFRPGRYFVNLYFGDSSSNFYELLYDAFSFQVNHENVYNSDRLLNPEWNSLYIPNISIVAIE